MVIAPSIWVARNNPFDDLYHTNGWAQTPYPFDSDSSRAFAEKYSAFTRPDAEGAPIPWSGLELGCLTQLMTNPAAFAMDRSGRLHQLVVVPGPHRDHDDNQLINVLKSVYPGWSELYPLPQHMLVRAILEMDLERLARDPVCPPERQT
jgi:hypothetical protein